MNTLSRLLLVLLCASLARGQTQLVRNNGNQEVNVSFSIGSAKNITWKTGSTGIFGAGSTLTVSGQLTAAPTSGSSFNFANVSVTGLNVSGLTGTLLPARLPTATTLALGGVKVDGTSITITDGVISAPATGTVTGSGLTAGHAVIGATGSAVVTSSVFQISGGNATVNGNLTVTGNQTIENLTTTTLNVTGNLHSTSVQDGDLYIGAAGTGNFTKARITPGTNVTVTNTANAIEISATSAAGTVTASGTPTSGQLAEFTSATNILGKSLGTGVSTALGVNVGSAGAPVLFNGAGGTPSAIALANGTGLPVATGISGLGTGVATALAVNVGSAGAPVVLNGAGGTPSSITLTNATGLPATTGINGVVPIANLATGTPDGTKFVRDDGTLAAPVGGMTNPMTTLGDSIVGGASGTPARLPIGSALMVRRVNAAGTGEEFVSPTVVGGVTLIVSGTVAVAAADIDITSIPATYSHLRLVIKTRGTNAATTNTIRVRCNGDTTAANYLGITANFQNGAATIGDNNGGTATILSVSTNGATALANSFGVHELLFHDYANTTALKTADTIGGHFFGTAAGGFYISQKYLGMWQSTAAINRITIALASANLEVGSKWWLYGIN